MNIKSSLTLQKLLRNIVLFSNLECLRFFKDFLFFKYLFSLQLKQEKPPRYGNDLRANKYYLPKWEEEKKKRMYSNFISGRHCEKYTLLLLWKKISLSFEMPGVAVKILYLPFILHWLLLS